MDYAFDADDLNKLYAFPVYRSRVDTTGDVVKPLCSFTAPADGTYRILVSAPKDFDDAGYWALIFNENGNRIGRDSYEVTLQAGETFKFRPQATQNGNESAYCSTRLKIQDKTCTDADNNNICDVCGSVCTGKVNLDGSFPVMGEIQLGELLHIGPTIIPETGYGDTVFAKIAFTPPADGEY